jgi:catechol 2,3-dioxygenase
MSITPDTTTRSTPANLRDDDITYGAVHLDVVDVDRSLRFWRDLIGLGELPSQPGELRLGVDERALIVLHPEAVRPVGRGHAGLYHVAIHLPDAVEFARVVVRLAEARWPQSPTDHVFSQATYLNDPDGILLELTLETPERFGSFQLGPAGYELIDSDGRRRGGTEPLDLEQALAPLAGGDPQRPLPSGSYVGHVHLHVPDLDAAHGFYRDVIGFREHSFITPIGMADLSAGGRFPHRIAINNWHGPAARQPAPGTAGMRRFELALHDRERFARVSAVAAARDEDGSLRMLDPAGNEIAIVEGAR